MGPGALRLVLTDTETRVKTFMIGILWKDEGYSSGQHVGITEARGREWTIYPYSKGKGLESLN